jgi:hypothetical protein
MAANEPRMKAVDRLNKGKGRRKRKYDEFQKFFDGAESQFKEFFKRDYGDSPPVQVAIRPGGRMGGKDERLVEIFFGPAHYDSIACEDRGLAKDASCTGSRTLVENGPFLVYQRADTGDVYCILYPATTDESKVDEEMLVLEVVRRPRRLSGLAPSHWRDLLAYKECTSLDGSPSCLQRLRCSYLRHFRKYGKDRKYQPAKVPYWVGQLLTVTASFALGGLITSTIEKRVFPDTVQLPTGDSGLPKQIGIASCQPSLPPKQSHGPAALRKKPSAP